MMSQINIVKYRTRGEKYKLGTYIKTQNIIADLLILVETRVYIKKQNKG